MEIEMQQIQTQVQEQKKNKKHTVAVADSVYKEIQKYVKKANEKERGKVISVADVIKYALTLMKDSDIKKIQEMSLTLKDKIAIEHERHIQKSGDNLTFDEYLALKLKIQ